MIQAPLKKYLIGIEGSHENTLGVIVNKCK
jgi:hypothetical protein